MLKASHGGPKYPSNVNADPKLLTISASINLFLKSADNIYYLEYTNHTFINEKAETSVG